MTGTDLFWCARINRGSQLNITLPEIILCDALHLLKNIGNFEVGGCLTERAFRDIVDLLIVEDTVQDALGLIQSFITDLLTLPVQMAVEFL